MEWVEKKVFGLVIECRDFQDSLLSFIFIFYNPIHHDLFKTFHKINYLLGHKIPF